MFARDNGRKASIGHYNTMFVNLLEHGGNMHPDLFTTGFFIGDFSLRRSPKLGSIMEK